MQPFLGNPEPVGFISRVRRMLRRLMQSRVALAALLYIIGFSANAEKKREELSPSEPAEAYFALVRGDTARENGNLAAALSAYEDALGRYERIAQKHPDWESDIVQYRIVYCRQQIEEMREKMSAASQAREPAAMTEMPATTPSGSPETGTVAQAKGTAETSAPTGEEADVEAPELPAETSEPSAASQEAAYLRNRIAELIEQVSELEEALEAKSDRQDDTQGKQECDALRQRADAAEARVRELEEEVRRLSRALAEAKQNSPAAEKSDEREYRRLLREALSREHARDFRAALALYEQARKKNDTDLQGILGQARCLIAVGQLDKALAFLEKQRDADGIPEIIVLRAAANGALGHYEKVAALLDPLRESGTTDPWVYNLLGAARLALGRYDEARDFLEKAIELDPNFPEPYYNLAVWYVTATNDAAKARELYQQSVTHGGPAEPAFDLVKPSP